MSLWAGHVIPLGHGAKQLGRQPSQKPLPTLQSVARGVAACPPQPLSPAQVCRGKKCRQGRLESLGRASRQRRRLVPLPTPGQPHLCLFPALYSFLAAAAESRVDCWGAGIATASPREEVSQHRRGQLRGLSWGGSSYPCPAGTARATGGRCNCSLTGGRKRGGETGLRPRERQRREN